MTHTPSHSLSDPGASYQKPPGARGIVMGRLRKHPDIVTDEYVWECARHLITDGARSDVNPASNTRG